MSIFEDARKGILVGDRIDNYIKSNPDILDGNDPGSGLTPLAIAVVGGFPEEVEQLLEKGAKVDGLSKNGETPLLLAAWKTTNERPLIIQLILSKTPSVDTTCSAAENKTRLMYAIENKDIDSIRMLRKAGANLKIKNDDGFNAKEVTTYIDDSAVLRALNPEKEQLDIAKVAAIVVSFILFIVAWVNAAFKEVVRRASGLSPTLVQRTNEDGFLKNVDEFVNDNPVLKVFFKDKKDFIQDLARKAADLEKDPYTALGEKDVLPKMIKVSLHKQAIYCDDSGSMHRDGRWDSQKKLIQRITKITTRILPEGEGVALRFINQEVENSSTLTLEQITKIMDPMPLAPGGNTEIGTYLRSKILEPEVYSRIQAKKLERPLLISIMTDGMPEPENESTLVNTILECGIKLQEAGYPRESVKFMIGQIGKAPAATRFLTSLKSNADIASVAFVTADKLDAAFADFHGNDRELDRWLIETLFSPLKEPETKKGQQVWLDICHHH